MVLISAIEKIMSLTGGAAGSTPAAIAKVLLACGCKPDIPDETVTRILKAGEALKKLGVS